MAGIYIHIPFCRQKCYYCDFYKTVNTSLKNRFLSVLSEEANVRKNYLQNEPVETIYFGGGTPSVLEIKEIDKILKMLGGHFEISKDAEITFEANPDDLSVEYLSGIRQTGVNRLSIGIQAFQDTHLKKMNRRHDAAQAVEVVENAARLGFDNLGVDLIYGLPNLTKNEWKESLKQVFQLPVQHLSAYHLTYHEGTAFYTWLKKGTLKELSETESVDQFNMLVNEAEKAGFEQYEISNFARDEKYSKHNTAYWFGKKYLGLGPSAHSFDLKSRCWNVSHIESYIKGIENKTACFEEEQLSEKDRFNEHILTRIRTQWGVSLTLVKEQFGAELENYLLSQCAKYIQTGNIQLSQSTLKLSKNALFISDKIMADLMII